MPMVQPALRAEDDCDRATPGCFWQAASARKRICMDHPEFEVIENDEEISIHFRRITPIYSATEGLSQRVLRSMVYRLLTEVPPASGGQETLLPRALMNSDMTTAAAI